MTDQYNADARVWQKLEPRRLARPKLLSVLSEKKLKELDMLEFARAWQPEECVGHWGE